MYSLPAAIQWQTSLQIIIWHCFSFSPTLYCVCLILACGHFTASSALLFIHLYPKHEFDAAFKCLPQYATVCVSLPHFFFCFACLPAIRYFYQCRFCPIFFFTYVNEEKVNKQLRVRTLIFSATKFFVAFKVVAA